MNQASSQIEQKSPQTPQGSITQTQKWLIIVAISAVFALLYLVSPVLTPFLIAALLAYLGDPIVNRLIRLKIPRTLAAIIVFLLLLFAVVLLLVLIIPLLEKQFELLIDRLPIAINWLQLTVLPWLNNNFNLSLNLDVNTLKNAVSGHWQQATDIVQYTVKTLHDSWVVLLRIVVNIILIPVVTFYLLRDWDTVVVKTKELIPRQILPVLSKLLGECNEVVGAFFRGQLLVMLILGLLYTIGLKIVGLEFALLIGVTIGILSIVPYLGSLVGVVIAMTATYIQFQDVRHLIFTLIVFAIGHVSEGMILTPLLIGDKIGLHPVAVIFAVLAGGQLFGFMGVLLALPVAAIIMVIMRHIYSLYLNTDFYNKPQASDVIDLKS